MPGQKGSMDERGVVRWTIPYFVEDLADVFLVGLEPPLPYLSEVDRNWSDDGEVQGVGLKVEVTYEGGSPDNQPDSYEFDSSFREETIIAHPLWSSQFKPIFKGKYDTENKTITFPEFLGEYKKGLGLPDGSSNSLAGQKDSNGREKNGQLKNPLFGVETFLSLASIFRHTYVRDSVSASIFERIGTIRKSLPGGFPTPSGHDWLIMPPKMSQRGSIYQITEEYMMSQPGGWPEAVYKLIN
jgi:hypothetical protein